MEVLAGPSQKWRCRGILILFILLLLPVVHIGVIAVKAQQLLVGTLFHNTALINYDVLVKLKQGKYPVGNDDGGPVIQVLV